MGYTRILKSPEKPQKNNTKDNIKSTEKTEQYKYLIHHKTAGKTRVGGLIKNKQQLKPKNIAHFIKISGLSTATYRQRL